MTTDNTDPNRVLLTGENSFIRLAVGDQETTRASHWRVLLSPVGAGHVLFIKSVPTEGVRIYAGQHRLGSLAAGGNREPAVPGIR